MSCLHLAFLGALLFSCIFSSSDAQRPFSSLSYSKYTTNHQISTLQAASDATENTTALYVTVGLLLGIGVVGVGVIYALIILKKLPLSAATATILPPLSSRPLVKPTLVDTTENHTVIAAAEGGDNSTTQSDPSDESSNHTVDVQDGNEEEGYNSTPPPASIEMTPLASNES